MNASQGDCIAHGSFVNTSKRGYFCSQGDDAYAIKYGENCEHSIAGLALADGVTHVGLPATLELLAIRDLVFSLTI